MWKLQVAAGVHAACSGSAASSIPSPVAASRPASQSASPVVGACVDAGSEPDSAAASVPGAAGKLGASPWPARAGSGQSIARYPPPCKLFSKRCRPFADVRSAGFQDDKTNTTVMAGTAGYTHQGGTKARGARSPAPGAVAGAALLPGARKLLRAGCKCAGGECHAAC